MLLVTGLKDRTRNTKNYIKIVDNPYSNTPLLVAGKFITMDIIDCWAGYPK